MATRTRFTNRRWRRFGVNPTDHLRGWQRRGTTDRRCAQPSLRPDGAPPGADPSPKPVVAAGSGSGGAPRPAQRRSKTCRRLIPLRAIGRTRLRHARRPRRHARPEPCSPSSRFFRGKSGNAISGAFGALAQTMLGAEFAHARGRRGGDAAADAEAMARRQSALASSSARCRRRSSGCRAAGADRRAVGASPAPTRSGRRNSCSRALLTRRSGVSLTPPPRRDRHAGQDLRRGERRAAHPRPLGEGAARSAPAPARSRARSPFRSSSRRRTSPARSIWGTRSTTRCRTSSSASTACAARTCSGSRAWTMPASPRRWWSSGR